MRKKPLALLSALILGVTSAGCGNGNSMQAMPETAMPERAVWNGDAEPVYVYPDGVNAPGGTGQVSGSGSGSADMTIWDNIDGDTSYLDSLPVTGKVYSQTVMIYMVGSNLESDYGSASMDMLEMEEAKPDTANNNVIVYTGGAKDWSYPGVFGDKNTTLKLTESGFEIIDTTSSKNMGKAKTLSDFISYCLDNYDTDYYSLILWDHGAGPVLGFGVDEKYGDSLSLREIQSALEHSVGESGKKLEWIGFDACLMNSLEVADVLEPYANYMIASQETEPGWGWNYAFLSGLSRPDMDGARLGREIVDSYIEYGQEVFDVHPRYYADLTLSCLNLTAYEKAETALNLFFGQMGGTLDATTFPAVVRRRSNVRNFGSFSCDYNYSLVDAPHLVGQFAAESGVSADSVLDALRGLIAYTRSNTEEAMGISICYPYGAEADYTDSYISWQESAAFAPNYVNFLKSFYAFQNGEGMDEKIDWDLSASETEVQELCVEQLQEGLNEYVETSQSMSDISLALTPKQQENFGYAGYMILCQVKGEGYVTDDSDERADDMYLFIHQSKDVTMDEDGVLHAYYSNSVIYMQDEEGLSTIPMILIENDSTSTEKRYLSYVILSGYRGEHPEAYTGSQVVLMQIAVNDEYPDGIIRSAVPVEDDDSQMQNPSKQLLDLEDFSYLECAVGCRYLTRDENGMLLPYFDWEATGWYMGFGVDLTQDYDLKVCSLQRPENYYCIFTVTDAQGNLFLSELIPLG